MAEHPTSVYMRLIEGVNKNLPTFHRSETSETDEPAELHYYDPTRRWQWWT
jgi:hypothetical protein